MSSFRVRRSVQITDKFSVVVKRMLLYVLSCDGENSVAVYKLYDRVIREVLAIPGSIRSVWTRV